MRNIAVERGARTLELSQLRKGIATGVRTRRSPNKDLGYRDRYTFVVVQRGRLVEDACHVVDGFVYATFVLEEIEVCFDEDLYASRHLSRRGLGELLGSESGVVIRHVAVDRDCAGQIFLGIQNVIAPGIIAAKLAQHEVTVVRRTVKTDYFVFEDTDRGE